MFSSQYILILKKYFLETTQRGEGRVRHGCYAGITAKQPQRRQPELVFHVYQALYLIFSHKISSFYGKLNNRKTLGTLVPFCQVDFVTNCPKTDSK
jgi:hypothetical protein